MKDIKESLKDVKSAVSTLRISEEVDLFHAKGRVLSSDVKAVFDLPANDNTALDGYAFAYKDIKNPLFIKGSIFAGQTKMVEIKDNECYKIMTGAMMPKGADTILRLEDECVEDGKLLVKVQVKKHNAVRFKAEELARRDLLFKKGEVLRAPHVALLASQGLDKVEVLKLPKVCVYASGDELKEPGEAVDKAGLIYNANAYGCMALLKDCKLSYEGIIKDDLKECENVLARMDCELLITSGGASVGEADFFKLALENQGFKSIFKSVKMKPGKPIKLYEKAGRFVLILPGNPLPAYLGAVIFAKYIIALLGGKNTPSGKIMRIKGEVYLKEGRDNIVLGNVVDGVFKPYDSKYGMAFLLPLKNCTHFCVLKSQQEEAEIFCL